MIGQFVAVLAAIALLALGALLPLLPKEARDQAGAIGLWLSALCVAIGTALLSPTFSEVRRVQQARDLLVPQLEPVYLQLRRLVKSLRTAIRELRDKSTPPEVACEVLAEQGSMLASTLVQLRHYSG